MNLLLYLFVAATWGGSYLAIRYAIDAWPVQFSVFVRLFIALLAFSVLAWARVPRPWRWTRPAQICFLSGLLSMGVGWSALFWAEQHIAPAWASIMISAMPIFTTLLMPLLHAGERLRWIQLSGILLGFAGLVIVFGPALAQQTSQAAWGVGAVLLVAILYALSTAMQRDTVHQLPASLILWWQMLGAFAWLVPMVLVTNQWPTAAALTNITPWVAVIFMSLSSTVLASIAYLRLMRQWGGVAASTVTYFSPVVSLLLDAWLLHLRPHWYTLAGTAVVIAGVTLARYQPAANIGKNVEPELAA